MRKLIILPGNSPKNKTWGEAFANEIGDWFDAVYQQSYTHWETGAEVIDFDGEAEKLRVALAEDGAEVQYVVCAKSFGTILTILSVHRNIIAPEKCVFFGMPLNVVAEHNVWNGEWAPLQEFAVPTLAFHNTNDPVANYAFTKEKVTETERTNITLLPLDDDTHSYDDVASYMPEMKDFLNL